MGALCNLDEEKGPAADGAEQSSFKVVPVFNLVTVMVSDRGRRKSRNESKHYWSHASMNHQHPTACYHSSFAKQKQGQIHVTPAIT